mgnify:FL=1
MGYCFVEEPGLYLLLWDNSYSNFTKKKLTYKLYDAPRGLWETSTRVSPSIQQSLSSRVTWRFLAEQFFCWK